MLVTLVGISIIIFVLLRVVPGNIVDILFDAAGFVDPTDKAKAATLAVIGMRGRISRMAGRSDT